MTNKNDTIQVAEQLYREKNPNSNMDTPSMVYEIVEKWKSEWNNSGSDLTLYDWIKDNK